MRKILNESKRDDMLLGYYNAIVESGIQISFGQFKSKLLQTLATNGGIHSLSQRSNYYLAGAARYYFNGDLTTNKNLSMFNPNAYEGNDTILDNWNDEVCKRLDACIKVLRNSYIDSVGTTFEQPEDFGTLPIDKLLRKYNKSINKVLGIVSTKKQDKHVIDDSPTVGNNYTFEIMYSQDDCQKYERPTAPGSWCITYGVNHYNYYIRNLGIHYVIFRRDGWENIQRPSDPLSEPGFTTTKPHDAYGNSLIALLQSNKSPEPVYITSRWNHGYEVSCEADHAYTKEEFQQITGVTDEDLKRIYDIWKQNKSSSTRSNNGNLAKQEINDAIRDLKYIQMRINAGENPNVLLYKKAIVIGNNDSKVQNCVSVCKVQPEGDNARRPVLNFSFLVDRGKIVYETLTKNSYQRFSTNNGLVALDMRNYDGKTTCFLYDTKSHRLVDIGGVVKFLSVPQFYMNENDCRYFTVNRSARDFALVDSVTKKPIQLPNGEYWANTIKTSSWDWSSNRGKNGARVMPNNYVICIVYDESSGEKYYFDTSINKFLQLNGLEKIDVDVSDPKTTDLGRTLGDYVTLRVMTRGTHYWNTVVLFNRATEKLIDFGVKPTFVSISDAYNNSDIFICTTNEDISMIGDAENNKLLKYKNGDTIKIYESAYVASSVDDDYYLMFVVNGNYARNSEGAIENAFVRILDLQTRTFLTNPYHTEADPTLFRTRNKSTWRINVLCPQGVYDVITDPKANQNDSSNGIIQLLHLKNIIDQQNNNGNEF